MSCYQEKITALLDHCVMAGQEILQILPHRRSVFTVMK